MMPAEAQNNSNRQPAGSNGPSQERVSRTKSLRVDPSASLGVTRLPLLSSRQSQSASEATRDQREAICLDPSAGLVTQRAVKNNAS